MKSWNRRYFTFDGKRLAYNRSGPNEKEVGSLAIDGEFSVKKFDGHENSFVVNDEYILAAESELDCQKWIDALQSAIEQ